VAPEEGVMCDRSNLVLVVLVGVASCIGRDVNVLTPRPDGPAQVCAQLDMACGTATPCCGIYICSNIGGSNICAESQLPPHKRMFVTNATYSGNLGGRSGADASCQGSATQASLGGTWKPWLSDPTTDAIGNVPAVGSWFLVNGTKVFESKAGFASAPLAAIDRDEHGNIVAGGLAIWTGTVVGGTRGTTNCLSWTATAPELAVVGTIGALTAAWTDNGTASLCEASGHLYCIEQ
jgi:hypothetical protein